MADNETPNSIPDSFFKNQMEEGQRLKDRRITSGQRIPNISPSTRDRIMSSLMAFQQGAAATQKAIPQGDAFGGFLAGFGGGLGAPSPEAIAAQRAQAQAEAQLAQIDATPIEQISPDLADAYGLHGVPLASINKVSPLIAAQERSRVALKSLAANIELRKELSKASPAMRALLSQAFGVEPEAIEGLKSSEAGPAFALTVKQTRFVPMGNRLVKVVTDRQGNVVESADMGFTSPVAGQVAKISGEIEGAKQNIDDLMDLADKVITADKPQNLTDFSAMVRQFKQGVKLSLGEKTGANLDAVRLGRGLDSALARFSRAVGEVGSLTNEDLARVKRAMPDVFDNKESFKQGLLFMKEQMDNIMAEKIAAYNAANIAGGSTAPTTAPEQKPKPKKPLMTLIREAGL